MWQKIYIVALLIATAVTAFLMYYANSWLNSIGSPRQALEGFAFYSGAAWAFLWASAIILLIIANVVLWRTRRSWPMWITLGYFAVFFLLRVFWLDGQMVAFASANNLPNAGVWIGTLLTLGLLLVALAIVFFNQFLITRMSEKMFPPVEAIDEIAGSDNEDIKSE